MSDSLFSTAQMSKEIGTDARTFRKFLRSDASPYEPVGQGARYLFSGDDGSIADLREQFSAWNQGRKSSTSHTEAPKRSKRSRIVEKDDPLAGDDVMTRLTSTIADRKRAHGLICNYKWRHPKVQGLDIKCSEVPERGERFCAKHHQEVWCGTENPSGNCGIKGHPYCKYHNGDISEEEFAKISTQTA